MKNLRKMMVIGMIIVTSLSSCKKEEVEGCTNYVAINYNVDAVIDDGSCILYGGEDYEPFDPDAPRTDCNCGIIQSDNIDDYSVVIRSWCSHNDKTFYLSEGDWMNAHPGNELCISNEDNLTGW